MALLLEYDWSAIGVSSGGLHRRRLRARRAEDATVSHERRPRPSSLPPIYPRENAPSFARRISLPLPAAPFTHPPVRESKVTVKIPRPLYRKIQLVVEGSGFNSPTDFVVYVLRDLMGEAEEHGNEFSQDELEAVKRKLKNLGYL